MTPINNVPSTATRLPLRILVPLTMLLLLCTATWSSHFLARRQILNAVEADAIDHLKWTAFRLAATFERTYRADDFAFVQETLSSLGLEPGIVWAVVVDEHSQVIASMRMADVGKSFDETLPDDFREFLSLKSDRREGMARSHAGEVTPEQSGTFLVANYPVTLGSEPGAMRPSRIGNLVVIRDISGVESKVIAGVYRSSLALFSLCGALTVAAWWFFHFRIANRLEQVVRASNAFAAGEATTGSGVTGNDEIGHLAAAVDAMIVTKQKDERDLESSHNMLRAILDAAVDGIITIRSDGAIQSVNRAAEQLFGYTAAEMIGQNVKLLMPAPYRDEHDGYLANYLQTGQRKIIGIGREVVGRRKDGSTFPMYLSVSEVTVQGERLFTGLVHDIRELKKAQEQLERLNAELEERVRQRTLELDETQRELVRKEKLATLGQLAGSVAHEVRNPLGVIKNAAYYLELQMPSSNPEITAAWSEHRRALTNAGRIISELLDYARDPRPQSSIIAPATLFERARKMVEIPDNISIELDGPSDSAMAFADADQIERVLINLIQNAVQAMPNGGTLTLSSLSLNRHQLALEVTDTGCGIAPSDQEKIFEPLFSRKVKGIGLGLALSKRYAELNQGTLSFESELGQGTTFRLTLPQATAT